MIVFLVLNVLRDTLVPFPGSKHRCRQISLGSCVLCSAHIVQVSCFLSHVLQTSFSGPDLPVHHHAVAGDAPRSDSEGSGVSVSLSSKALPDLQDLEGRSPPGLSFCTARPEAAGSHLFL